MHVFLQRLHHGTAILGQRRKICRVQIFSDCIMAQLSSANAGRYVVCRFSATVSWHSYPRPTPEDMSCADFQRLHLGTAILGQRRQIRRVQIFSDCISAQLSSATARKYVVCRFSGQTHQQKSGVCARLSSSDCISAQLSSATARKYVVCRFSAQNASAKERRLCQTLLQRLHLGTAILGKRRQIRRVQIFSAMRR